MNKRQISLIVLNILLIFLLIGFLTSFKIIGIIFISLIGLTAFVIPIGLLIFLFGKYKQLWSAYNKVVQFLMLIQQELQAVDRMQLTNLQIVNLKQKVKITKQFLEKQKARKKNGTIR